MIGSALRISFIAALTGLGTGLIGRAILAKAEIENIVCVVGVYAIIAAIIMKILITIVYRVESTVDKGGGGEPPTFEK